MSKLRELKTSQIGIHYNNENSYQRKIIDDSYSIDTKNWIYYEINEEKKINTQSSNNYFYLYLKEGSGEINGIHFSGKSSSLLLYSQNSIEINIKPINSIMKFYYLEEKRVNIQSLVDLSSGGKFMFKKDFPFEFYTQIDGTKDITFNIQFLTFEYNETRYTNPDILQKHSSYVVNIKFSAN